MPEQSYTYIIVGAGLAGGCAADAIREHDKKGSVLLVGDEKHLPYDRPHLSKKLWFGKKKVEEIFLHDQNYYDENGIHIKLGTRIVELDARRKAVRDGNGSSFRYEKLLLATGGIPRTLPIPGGNLEGVCYYRYLDDYLRIRKEAKEGKSAVVIGGGFIGSEIAAALNINRVKVTMIFPEPYLVQRVFPDYLGKTIQQHYIEREITILNGDKPSSFVKNGDKFITRTGNGKQVESDLLIVGIGITPVIDLAQQAGLKVGNGIVVNEYLQTSDPNIYAAGDNAYFPYQALGQNMRVEHWDNAINQGKWAGRNMAGAYEQFDYMPYFFSDLFEFGYEAVGEVDSQIETFADWQKENDTGVIYYLKEGKVRGLMMCNVWGKVDAARELIKKGERVRPESLAGIIR
ncbi:MAG: FAD-dependent oxidoreductase [candidate division Zixibacteria bacterium]|nr:FAD-dependent oxidoreductase [candidate division Zixibacteria bacterium]